jgi:hypothetical protein
MYKNWRCKSIFSAYFMYRFNFTQKPVLHTLLFKTFRLEFNHILYLRCCTLVERS